MSGATLRRLVTPRSVVDGAGGFGVLALADSSAGASTRQPIRPLTTSRSAAAMIRSSTRVTAESIPGGDGTARHRADDDGTHRGYFRLRCPRRAVQRHRRDGPEE